MPIPIEILVKVRKHFFMADSYPKKLKQPDSPWISLQKIQNMMGETPINPTSPYMYGDVPDDGKRYDRVDKEKAKGIRKGIFGD